MRYNLQVSGSFTNARGSGIGDIFMKKRKKIASIWNKITNSVPNKKECMRNTLVKI